ncbi:MAG: hypothetical protein KH828_11240 [Clostridiales bacterium]|nr:hypothetical protein [Clostridiales bacterium]
MTELEKMKKVDIKTVSRDELVDIAEVSINTQQPIHNRIRSYIEQIKNPYCFKCNDYIVKISFADTEVTLEEKLQELIFNTATAE